MIQEVSNPTVLFLIISYHSYIICKFFYMGMIILLFPDYGYKCQKCCMNGFFKIIKNILNYTFKFLKKVQMQEAFMVSLGFQHKCWLLFVRRIVYHVIMLRLHLVMYLNSVVLKNSQLFDFFMYWFCQVWEFLNLIRHCQVLKII